jgi:hypothetical protein
MDEIFRSFSAGQLLVAGDTDHFRFRLGNPLHDSGAQQRVRGANVLPSEWFRALPCRDPFCGSKPHNPTRRPRCAPRDRHEQ